MRTRLLLALATLAVLAASAAWLIAHRGEPAQAVDHAAPAAADAPAPGDAPGAEPVLDQRDADTAERDRVLEAYFEPLRFRDEITAFIDAVPHRSTADNAALAGTLRERIRAYQRDGFLALAQARYLEGTIVTAIYADDPDARRRELEALKTDYAALAEAPSTTHLDERFDAYKQREAEIVRDVLAREPPAGLTRDQWLRQRLDALRAEIYAEQ